MINHKTLTLELTQTNRLTLFSHFKEEVPAGEKRLIKRGKRYVEIYLHLL
jgi:hypothetical protein